MLKIELPTGVNYIHLGTGEKNSMRGNDGFLLTRGSIDVAMPFHLYDAAGAAHSPATLVYLMVRQRHKDPPFSWTQCVITSRNAASEPFFVKGYFVFDEIKANLAAGEYKLRFKVFYEDASKDFFPLTENESVGKLHVSEVF